MIRIYVLALCLSLTLLPACGAATLLAPLIDKAIDGIFDDGGSGDQVKDNTEIGQAVDLEISFGGRVCSDPADGVNQKVATIRIQHTGPKRSEAITFNFIPESGSKLSADPATGTLTRGEVQTIEIFASDSEFDFQDFRMRTFFLGNEGVPGRSTTTLLTITNVCSDLTPALVSAGFIASGTPIRTAYIDALSLLDFDEAVAHGDVSVPDKIPDIPLSQISYYGMLKINLDATALDDLFTGGSAIFPTGDGSNGTVFEADTTAAMVPGEYLIGFVAYDGKFALIDTTREWRFGLVFDSDGLSANDYFPPAQTANDPTKGTDRWYFLDFSPGSDWNLRLIDSSNAERATAARVIQFENALMFVIPKSEVPGPGAGYRVLTFTHDGSFGLDSERDWSGDHHPLPALAAVPD